MAYELIKKTVASTASASLSFTNIPQTYKDLKAFATLRSDGTGNRIAVTISYNSDTNTANYKGYEWYYEDGTMGGEINSATSASRNLGAIPGSTGDTNQFGAFETIIQNYANTSAYKVSYTSIAEPRNSSPGYSYWDRGTEWLSSSAITSITFAPVTGNLLSQSTIWLYGLK